MSWSRQLGPGLVPGQGSSPAYDKTRRMTRCDIYQIMISTNERELRNVSGYVAAHVCFVRGNFRTPDLSQLGTTRCLSWSYVFPSNLRLQRGSKHPNLVCPTKRAHPSFRFLDARLPTTTMSSRMVSSPTSSRPSDGALPFHTSPSTSDFQIERGPKSYPTVSRRLAPRDDEADYHDEYAFRESVSKLLLAKARPFAVAGRIPFDPSNLILFFRSKVRRYVSFSLMVLTLLHRRAASHIRSISPSMSSTIRLPLWMS